MFYSGEIIKCLFDPSYIKYANLSTQEINPIFIYIWNQNNLKFTFDKYDYQGSIGIRCGQNIKNNFQFFNDSKPLTLKYWALTMALHSLSTKVLLMQCCKNLHLVVTEECSEENIKNWYGLDEYS